jgi:hypothetical protein
VRVSLLQIVAAARLREASLAAESAGYILLAAADQVATAPRRVTLAGVDLGDDGRVRLSTGEPCTEQAAERELRALLEQLLLVASSSTPALLRVARHAETAGLGGLVRELEAALIPVNRAAAQRALARLVRETARAMQRGLEVVEEPSRVESPLVAALLATPTPTVEPRRVPPVPAPTLTLREVSSPAPPVAVKIAVDVRPAPIPALEVPIIRAPQVVEQAPELVAALEGGILESTFEVEVEVEFEEERSPREAETRPEPVVSRSVAPPAPPILAGSPLETPRLGTMVAVSTFFQETPPEYELTERMPPIALLEGGEAPEASECVSMEEAAPAEAVPAEAVPAEAVPAEAAPAEAAPAEAVESIAGPDEQLDQVAIELDPEILVDASDESIASEPVAELEVIAASEPVAEFEVVAASDALPELLEESDIVEEELPLELAFTPTPHRAATVTLEALRGPNFEPEPDYEPEPLPEYEPEPEPEPTPPSLPRVQLRREPMRSDIQDLLRGFRNETGPSEPELSRELRTLAGLDLTPPPTTAGDR